MWSSEQSNKLIEKYGHEFLRCSGNFDCENINVCCFMCEFYDDCDDVVKCINPLNQKCDESVWVSRMLFSPYYFEDFFADNFGGKNICIWLLEL